MRRYLLLKSATRRIGEILKYTEAQWGREQAESYITGLFDCIEAAADRKMLWRRIPAEFGIDGYFCQYEHHYIYWKTLANDRIGIVTILHERMNLAMRLRTDAERGDKRE